MVHALIEKVYMLHVYRSNSLGIDRCKHFNGNCRYDGPWAAANLHVSARAAAPLQTSSSSDCGVRQNIAVQLQTLGSCGQTCK